MAIDKNELYSLIKEKFPEAEFKLVDLVGDGDHYELTIASEQFIGISTIAQHRLVYQALGEMVGTSLHALALKTKIKQKG
jgi:stress-induced morphogen